jgi:hypothetical protein
VFPQPGANAGVSLEGGLFLARRHVPQVDHPFPTARGQHLAVRAKGHAPHLARVALEGRLLLARRHVPHLDAMVSAPRGQRLAVLAKGHGGHLICVPLEGVRSLLAGQRRRCHQRQPGHTQPHHHPPHSARIRLHR